MQLDSHLTLHIAWSSPGEFKANFEETIQVNI